MKSNRLLLVAFVLVASAACTTHNQVTLPSIQRMYLVTFDNATPGPNNGLVVYAPAFSTGSTPSLSIIEGSPNNMNAPGEVLIDKSGEVVLLNDGGTPFVTVYAQPISTSSAPFAQFNTGTTIADNVYGGGFDSNGTLWISNRRTPGQTVATVAPPFTNSSTPTTVLTVTNGLTNPVQIAFDNNGHMAVAEETSHDVLVYNTPVTSASTPAANIGLTGTGQGVAFDSTGRLFATSGGSNIEVFTSPFTTGEIPAFTITQADNGNAFIAFDRFGNLWVPQCGSGAIQVLMFSPPFSAASTPALMIPSTEDCLFGVAFGP
jgi:hypothetical protein